MPRQPLFDDDPESVDGSAYSELPHGYEGPCRMTYEGSSGANQAVFPDVQHARAAASFAIKVDHGGYRSAVLSAALASEVTHATWTDWVGS